MIRIEKYWYGYVVAEVNYIYETLETIVTPRTGFNIFGHTLELRDIHRVDFCRFIAGRALSTNFKTYEEAKKFYDDYNNYLDTLD